jgi:hypothetical protein
MLKFEAEASSHPKQKPKPIENTSKEENMYLEVISFNK